MTIYSVNSNILYEAPLTNDALIKYELMGDYYIELPFDAGSYIDIPRGSYIDHEGTRYTVMENILPEPKAEGGYHYAVKFWAGQSFMKNRKLFWLKGANKEFSFHITTTIDQFGQLVVDNMNEFMPGKWELSSLLPADALTVTKTISFEGDTCWDAVSSIAEAYGIEWWVHHDEDTMELHFGKLEGGNLVDFKVGEAITSIPSQKGDDSQYGTRFYVYGSNQNLPEGYGDTEQGGTVHHVSNPRLMLPSGIDYIDAKRDMTPAEIIEQVVIFEDVYPKNTDTVTAVTTVQRPIENAAEGQPQTFTAYQLIAANTPFLPSDVMEGETLRLVFNSGALTGVEFEVDLRDADDNHIDPIQWKPEDGFIKKFELIAITEQVGDTVATLPNESVHPVVGDEFVLLGVRLSDDKVREAEEELLQRGEEWKDEHSKDTSVYNCPTNPVYCKRGLLSFALGQRVRLYDPRFDGGYRDSRIQGFEKRIWNEYIATYTIGDNAAYTRIGAVESSVANLKTTERTIGMILDELASTAKDLSDMFEMVEYNKTKMIRANYDFFSVGGVTAGGIGSSSGGSGGGGSATLAGLNDVALKSAIANDMLVYNGTHWVNTPMSAIKPDLTAYATKSWVEDKGYITASALDPYATTADVANTYATQTALQGVDIRVQAIEYIFEKDQDGVINKWSEIVDFLAGVEGDTLDSILEQFATKDSLSGYMSKTGGTFSGNVTAPTFIGDLQGLAEVASVSRGLARKTNEITTQEEFDSFLFNDRLAFTQFRGGSSYGSWDTSGVRGGDGMLISVPWSNTNFGAQLAFDDERPYMALRAKSNGTWSGWQQFAFKSDIPTNYLQKSNADWYGIMFNSTSEGGGVRMVLQNTGVLKSGFGSNNDSTYIVDYTAGSNLHLNTKLEFEYDGKRNEVLHGGNYTNFNGRKLQTLRVDGDYWYPDNYFLYGQWASDNGSILDWKVDNYAVRVDIAKKLATPRTIWGQSFDGTADISGGAKFDGNVTIKQSLFVDKNIYVAESSSDGGIYFGDDEFAYIKESPDDVMTIASNQGLILRVNHISDEGAVIRMEGPVRIGDAILDWDAANKCITIKNVNTGQKASLFVDGGVTGTAIN